MDELTQISSLKSKLRKDVACLFRNREGLWTQPIREFLQEMEEEKTQAVIFGGTLRSLLHFRLFPLSFNKSLERPRDIDIVVKGKTIDRLKHQYSELIERETRFGGLKLRKFFRENREFDIWPLENTWAFLNEGKNNPCFDDLPFTTFLNVEAIAIDVWPIESRGRKIYSGSDQFFKGILYRTIEINSERNPFPALNIIRSIIMAAKMNYKLGSKLARYISTNSNELGIKEIEDIQLSHYGEIKIKGNIIKDCIYKIQDAHFDNPMHPLELPQMTQVNLKFENQW